LKSYWRQISKPIIGKVLRKNRQKTDKEIRKALSNAYPFGEKARWPYKIWLDEIKLQWGKKRNLYKPKESEIEDPAQLKLFEND
jgi:hypothetical protein